MRNKPKKKRDLRSLRNSIPVTAGKIRLATTSEISEEVLEASLLIVGTLSGAFPLMPIEEAMQTCYDSLMEGVTQEELPALGVMLSRLSESDCGVLQ